MRAATTQIAEPNGWIGLFWPDPRANVETYPDRDEDELDAWLRGESPFGAVAEERPSFAARVFGAFLRVFA